MRCSSPTTTPEEVETRLARHCSSVASTFVGPPHSLCPFGHLSVDDVGLARRRLCLRLLLLCLWDLAFFSCRRFFSLSFLCFRFRFRSFSCTLHARFQTTRCCCCAQLQRPTEAMYIARLMRVCDCNSCIKSLLTCPDKERKTHESIACRKHAQSEVWGYRNHVKLALRRRRSASLSEELLLSLLLLAFSASSSSRLSLLSPLAVGPSPVQHQASAPSAACITEACGVSQLLQTGGSTVPAVHEADAHARSKDAASHLNRDPGKVFVARAPSQMWPPAALVTASTRPVSEHSA